MKKHRGLFLALGLLGLSGLMASSAKAETIIMTVSTNGHTFTFTGGSNSLTVATSTLNTALKADGSAYQFSSLGASSNFPGTTGPNGGSLTTAGGVFVGLPSDGFTGVTGNLVITTTESGFTAPTGTDGMLASTATSNYTNVATGTESYSSSFNSTNSATGSSSSSGTTTNSPPITIPSLAIGSVASGYSLTNNLTINLTQNTTAQAQLGFSGAAQVTASSVPEPASIVMMLTGMPLPLVIIGLIRRRRAAAAA